MMIKAPLHSGDYAQRREDCLRAIEHPTRMMLGGSRAPFFDFSSLLYAVLPAAEEAGWQESEVRSALENLVRDLRPAAR